MTAQKITVLTVKKVLFENTFLKDALSDADRLIEVSIASKEGSDEKDVSRLRASVHRLSKGVVERHFTLDAILSKISSVPVKKISRPVYPILLVGLYELFYSDRKPYAVVNEAVKLTEETRLSGLKSFVNGVLRNASRRKEELLSLLSLQERISLPDLIYQSFVDWYGEEETERIGTWFMAEDESRITVRRTVSTISDEAFQARLQSEDAFVKPLNVSDDLYELSTEKPVGSLPAFNEGLFYVQDVSSALSGNALADLMEPHDSDFHVMDACSAPGGKVLHLADLARENAQKTGKTSRISFLALDVSEKKRALIEENRVRLGFPEIETGVQDASKRVDDFVSTFDLVLLDVPCSGLGILKRKPDIKEHLTKESIGSLVSLQRSILKNACEYVKPGGTLFYSTCTIDPAENSGQVETFLSDHPDFVLVTDRLFLPGAEGTDGFYFARMRRKNDEN